MFVTLLCCDEECPVHEMNVEFRLGLNQDDSTFVETVIEAATGLKGQGCTLCKNPLVIVGIGERE
jgi:hypothetical protein